MLYSKNKFKLGPEDLNLLSPAAGSKMLSLQVRLTTCSCVTAHHCPGIMTFQDFYECGICHHYCKRGPGSPFTLRSDDHRRLLGQWQNLCNVLRSQCSQRLRLTVICDCEDFQTALEVVKPLKNFPTFFSCSIRLGQSPNDQLRRLAEETAS